MQHVCKIFKKRFTSIFTDTDMNMNAENTQNSIKREVTSSWMPLAEIHVNKTKPKTWLASLSVNQNSLIPCHLETKASNETNLQFHSSECVNGANRFRYCQYCNTPYMPLDLLFKPISTEKIIEVLSVYWPLCFSIDFLFIYHDNYAN